jgi:flagellar FliJ protein
MDTLNMLLEHAEAQRNVALAAFNQARVRRDAMRTQALELAAYRDDYQQRWNAQFYERGAALDIVRCYRQFADRLEMAIAQQDQAVTVADHALVRANDTLAAHELRVASVRKLIERRQAELKLGADRREQRTTDELALRMQRGRRGALDFEGTQT